MLRVCSRQGGEQRWSSLTVLALVPAPRRRVGVEDRAPRLATCFRKVSGTMHSPGTAQPATAPTPSRAAPPATPPGLHWKISLSTESQPTSLLQRRWFSTSLPVPCSPGDLATAHPCWLLTSSPGELSVVNTDRSLAPSPREQWPGSALHPGVRQPRQHTRWDPHWGWERGFQQVCLQSRGTLVSGRGHRHPGSVLCRLPRFFHSHRRKRGFKTTNGSNPKAGEAQACTGSCRPCPAAEGASSPLLRGGRLQVGKA